MSRRNVSQMAFQIAVRGTASPKFHNVGLGAGAEALYDLSSCIVFAKDVYMSMHPTEPTDHHSARKAWMSLLAKAPEGAATALFDAALARPDFTWLRQPEVSSVMVQGRAGGTGAPFNLGEMTVTRAALQLPCGTVGHAYLQGRRKPDAQIAALIDALMQTDQATGIRAAVLTPLSEARTAKRATRAAKAAATKVDFFTMVRGDD